MRRAASVVPAATVDGERFMYAKCVTGAGKGAWKLITVTLLVNTIVTAPSSRWCSH